MVISPFGGAIYWSGFGWAVGLSCAGTEGDTVVTPGGKVGSGVVITTDGLQPKRLNLIAGAPVYSPG